MHARTSVVRGHLAGLDPAEQERWRLSFFGAEQGLSDIARMRLSEHALHTWDVAVAVDSKAALAGDATELILDTLPGFAPRIGQPAGEKMAPASCGVPRLPDGARNRGIKLMRTRGQTRCGGGLRLTAGSCDPGGT